MQLKAGLAKQHVQSNDMKYEKPGASNSYKGEYDACYYEIKIDEAVLEQYIPKKLHVHVSRKLDMNVFVYGGPSKFEAKQSIIPGNEQATVGATYSIGSDSGLLIVAYPDLDVNSEFGFNYWLEAELKPTPEEENQSDG